MTADAPSGGDGPRYLAIKLSSLGDLFHALPAVQRIKTVLHARVDWVTQPEYAELVRCFGGVDRVIVFPRRGIWRGAPAFLRDLRRDPYTAAADFQGLFKSALAAFLSRSRERVGPSFERECARFLYTRVAGRRDKNRHAVEECLEVAAALGAGGGDGRIALPFRFPPFTPAGPGPRVAVSPATRWPTKNWPASRFAEALTRIQAETGASVFLLGGPLDRYLCEGLAARLPGPVFNLAGRLSLPQMGGVLERMDLLVSNDTGPMHMAAALGVPVVAVFGPTDPARTGPYGPGHTVVTATACGCRPCFQRECRQGGEVPACLAGVEAKTVARAAVEALAARARNA